MATAQVGGMPRSACGSSAAASWTRGVSPCAEGGDAAVQRDGQRDAQEDEAELRAQPHTFDAFFSRYEQQVFGYLVRMTGDEQTARDLSQEAFLRAWQHFDKLLTYDHPSAWLFRVATNLALSHLRRRVSPVGSAKLLGDDDSPARSDPAMRFIERDLIEHILLELPPKQRAALVLREINGLSCSEVAQALGMSRDAVKMALWRARVQFRTRYVRGGGRL